MSLNPHYSAAARNAAINAITALLNTGTIEIRDGTQPVTPETTATGALLATLTLNATAFGAASAGSAAAGAITGANAVASSTATWFRIKASGGTAHWDGSVGLATSDLVLNAVVIASGAAVTCSALTLSIAA